MFGEPVVKEISNGIRFFWLPTDKFKTVTVKMYIHQELNSELASKTALLPAVLERGTRRYPDRISLQRELENLYGSDLSTDVGKKGERHIIEIGLEMVHPDYLQDKKLLQKGLKIMEGVFKEPLIENEGFRRSYVHQEKDQLIQEIKSLINDKTSYAMERCIKEMCSDEPYGVYKLGDIDLIEKITPEELYIYSKQILEENPIDIYIVGLQEEKEVEALMGESFSFSRSSPVKTIPFGGVSHVKKQEIKIIKEFLNVNQGKLIMGYRTNIPYNHELYFPLVFYNGILGGFPHSKLFQNVREKASLAYFVFSRMERHKGLMIVAAGIESKDYEKTVAIVQEQIEAIARGDITLEEMENTRIGFINQLRAQADSAGSMINFYLDADIGGRKMDFAIVMEELQKVTIEDVVAAAKMVELDTVYFLSSEEEGGKV